MKAPMMMMWCVAAHLAVLGAANAQDQPKDPWIGRRVFTQAGAVLRVGNQVVDDEGRAASLNSSGRDRNESRVYRVKHTNGNWLWLQDERSGASGWVESRWVVPYEQAIDFYTNEIRANPQASLYNKRGNVWSAKGEYDIAIADYNEAIRLDPSDATPYCARGVTWERKKEYDEAIADYNEAIRLDPRFAMAYLDRALAWKQKKEYDKAIADYNEAIRLDPKHALAYNNRGVAWEGKKEYDKAIADYNEAIRLDPRYATAYNNRAWIWATCPVDKLRDGKKAVDTATKACELTEWKNANDLDTLAAAYAESGDFEKADEWQVKANKLFTDAEIKKGGEERLNLYRQKKPYRAE